ncbi:ABC transporter permease [Bacillus sp. NPDC057893]|uniref:ABC transporter permease n=1 Tax=Bacillus sp. NPDC057893 TaxID=3346273 RepID=UPI00366ED676
MKMLIRAEWERLWAKKVTWLCFFAVPIMLFASAKVFLKHNEVVPANYSDHTYANSFPFMGLSEQLLGTFNMILLITIILMFSHEYHSGQMRMVLQRSYSYKQVLLAKIITTLLTMLLFLTIYFICSYVVGFIFFDYQTSIVLLLHTKPSTGITIVIYNILYYLIAYITLVAMTSVLVMLTVMSKSTTGATLLGMGFMLFSAAYPNIIQIMESSTLLGFINYTSLFMLQYNGIATMLLGYPPLIAWCLGIMFLYIILCNLITFRVLSNKDNFI